jgi:hypothetical protein
MGLAKEEVVTATWSPASASTGRRSPIGRVQTREP